MNKKNMYFAKKTKILLLAFLCISPTKIYTKTFVNVSELPSAIQTRILPLLQKYTYPLDEIRWSVGEIILNNSSKTITEPGLYILGQDLDGSIVIASDNVTIDLNGYTLKASSGQNGVNTYNKNITILNGSIKGEPGSLNGIFIGEGSNKIAIKHVTFFDFEDTNAIHFAGSLNNKIKSCNIKNCNFKNCKKGIFATYLIKSIFENCSAYNCIESGFELNNSQFNYFFKCKSLKTKNDYSDKNAIGFLSISGAKNIFKECLAEGTQKNSGNFGINAAGFSLKGTSTTSGEIETKIVDCIVNATDTSLTYSSVAYGIQLDSVLKPSPLSNVTTTTTKLSVQRAVSWSPESKFLAVGGQDNKVTIYYFENSTLIPSAETTLDQNVTSLAWSPKGDFLAIGISGNPGGDEVFIYRFNSSSYSQERLKLIDSLEFSLGVSSLDWHPSGKYIAISNETVSTEQEIQIFAFDGTQFSSNTIGSINSNDFCEVSFSPDGKFVAFTMSSSDKFQIYRFDPTITENALQLKAEKSTGSSIAPSPIDWSPTSCNNYIIAVGYSDSDNVEVFSYNGNSSISDPLDSKTHGAPVISVKWSPNGKYLTICGAEGNSDKEIRIYSFDGFLTEQDSNNRTGTQNSIVWSHSGRYIISVGSDSPTDNIKIYDVSNIPIRCIIENNEVCNCHGGLCGIGIEGSSGNNLITANIGYENNINFSSGIFNTFKGGLNGNPTIIENISVPPYEN